jgi:hypothetical protein
MGAAAVFERGMVVMSSAMGGKSKATTSYPRIHDRHTGCSIDVR